MPVARAAKNLRNFASSSLCILLVMGLAGCGGPSRGKPKLAAAALPQVTVEEAPKWEKAVSLADRERLKGVKGAWTEALREANKGGFKQAVRAEGKLLDPAAALLSPAPTPGNYKCRLIQVGGAARGHRPFAASKPAFCYVGVDDDGRLWLDKQTGVQQKTGPLFEDEDPKRMIFVGQSKAAKPSRKRAGSMALADAAGVFERIGPMRYRLTIPRPESKYKLELLELTPAPIQLDS